jgi:hypothetical protein
VRGTFKDQPDQERFNPPQGRLIENHRQTLPKFCPAGQGDMQGNQKLRGQADIVQEAILLTYRKVKVSKSEIHIDIIRPNQ